MALSATAFRQDVFKLLDRVARTGEPLEVIHKGRKLKVISEEPKPDRFARLVAHDAIVGDPEELAELDMSETWQGEALL